MASFLIDLVVSVFDVVLDVVLFRRLRRHRGHSDRSFSEDAREIAHFDFFTVAGIALASAALMLFLVYVVGLPAGPSIVAGVVLGVMVAVWKYMGLIRQD